MDQLTKIFSPEDINILKDLIEKEKMKENINKKLQNVNTVENMILGWKKIIVIYVLRK